MSKISFRPYKEQEIYRLAQQQFTQVPFTNFKKHTTENWMCEDDCNRLVEMAWQDRVPFEIIQKQYGLSENQLKNKMRSLLSQQAYKRWRKRVQGRRTKHTKKLSHKPIRFQGPW
jgi:uncharacterized protein (TIGR03643 family)